ncbi:HEAT repeat domain-containing protein, partial [Hyella patelloides]|uniref:HEAT repeat domain-containing protein n=1 Tax=Hyella patelloides TaxID=1982969 RepID=UPI0011A2EBD8
MNEADNNKLFNLQQEARSETTSPERLTKLALQSDTLAQIVASNVAAPPELLKKLYLNHRYDREFKKALVNNPNTPTKVLFQLGEYFPQDLLFNPTFNLLYLENPNFVRELPVRTLFSLVLQHDTPRFILEYAAKHENKEIAESSQLHVNLSGEINSQWHETAHKILKKHFNRYTHTEKDERFLGNLYEFILPHIFHYREYKICVAYNQQSPNNILEKLALDNDKEVRLLVAKNKNSSTKILELLATDKDNLIRQTIAENSYTPAHILSQLAIDENNLVRQTIAENPHTPAHILSQFANQKKYLYYVAKNPSTSLNTLEQIATDKNYLVCRGLLKNPNIPTYLISKFANQERYSFDESIAKNPNTSLVILEQLATDKDSLIRQSVAENLKTPVTILEQFATDRNYRVRASVAKNPNISIKMLERLAIDKEYLVRQSVAENIKTPVTIL